VRAGKSKEAIGSAFAAALLGAKAGDSLRPIIKPRTNREKETGGTDG